MTERPKNKHTLNVWEKIYNAEYQALSTDHIHSEMGLGIKFACVSSDWL